MALKEFKLLTQLNHPKIIKMHEAFFNKSRETLYMVMDLIEGPTLKKYVKDKSRTYINGLGLPEREAKGLFRQILEAISYIHSPKISVCHRYDIQPSFLIFCYSDINPNNIMIKESKSVDIGPELTLIDFNVARRFKEPNTNSKLLMLTNTGAPAYVAPEI